MGYRLHELHATAYPANEAQALAADAALFGTITQAIRIKDAPSDVLARLKDQTQRITEALEKLWPDDHPSCTTCREQIVYGDLTQQLAEAQTMLAELIELATEKEAQEPRGSRHYLHGVAA